MATIKEIFDLYTLFETKFNSIRCAKNSFQAQRNSEVSLQLRETKTTEQANFFFSLGTLNPCSNVYGTPSDSIVFLLTITPPPCKNLAAHLSNCRLNSGCISVSWKCFSCSHLVVQLFRQVGTAVICMSLWVTKKTKTGNIHSLSLPFFLSFWSLCQLLLSLPVVRETCTHFSNQSII